MKTLSVIIPVYNEEKTIAQVIKRVFLQEIGEWEKQVIVVDDGSTDGTDNQLQIANNQFPNIKIVRHERNLGKGAAIRTGLKQATGDLVVIQDADLEYDPKDWLKMIKELQNNPGLVAVYGSRELNPERKGYWFFVLGVRILAKLITFLYGAEITDPYTCYKLFQADFLKRLDLKSNGFEIEAEITCKALRAGGKIKEVPISYFPRSFSQGKKIKTKDGLRGILTIIKLSF